MSPCGRRTGRFRGAVGAQDLPCETLDGHRLTLLVNTGLMTEVAQSLDQGAEGVGCTVRDTVPAERRFPTEEEQRLIYRSSWKPSIQAGHHAHAGHRRRQVAAYFPIVEDNPSSLARIRVTLDHPNCSWRRSAP